MYRCANSPEKVGRDHHDTSAHYFIYPNPRSVDQALLHHCGQTRTHIGQCKSRGACQPVFIVINIVAAQGQVDEETVEAVDIQVCPVRLVSRIAFSRSLINGQTAQEFKPNGKAAHEIAHMKED